MKAWRDRAAEGGDASSGGVKIPNGGGAPLPGAVRRNMEHKLGEDLSDVAIHTGGDSAAAADGLNARAFTTGRDVHFGRGQFDPSSKDGTKLLAHELTHVVQAKRGGEAVARSAEPEESEAGPVAEHEGEPLTVSDPNEPAEQEADEVADAVTKEDEPSDGEMDSPNVAAKSPSVAAKLKGVGRKVFRHVDETRGDETAKIEDFPAPGADNASEPSATEPGATEQSGEEARGYMVQTPSGEYPLAESDLSGFIEEVTNVIFGEAQAELQATEAMRSKAEQYNAKYTEGWRSHGLSLLGQQPPTLDLTIFDLAVLDAANFVAALESTESIDTLNFAHECGKASLAQRDRAIAELKRWEEMDGYTSAAVLGNLQDKAGISLLAFVAGSLAMGVVQLTGPALPATMIAGKVIGALAGGATAGAATEMNRQMKRGASPTDVEGGKVLREALVQATPNALWGYLGGTVLATQLVAKLPEGLVRTVGAGAANLIGSIGQSLAGLWPIGKVSELMRGKPDSAAYDPNEIATEAAELVDLGLLTAELEQRAPKTDLDPMTVTKPTSEGAPPADGETTSEEEDPEPANEAPSDEEPTTTSD